MDMALTVLERTRPGISACSLLEIQGKKVLLDCGYDDSQPLTTDNTSLPVPAKDIGAVILSHGHLGHCGLLPTLVREGFSGRVFGTQEAIKVAVLNMLETALVQKEEQEYWKVKGSRQAAQPLYTEAEVEACRPRLSPCGYDSPVKVDQDLSVRFFRAGHGPGAAIVALDVRHGGGFRRILYVGDVGAGQHDLYAEGVVAGSYDTVLVPASGVRRGGVEDPGAALAEVIHQAQEAVGNIVVLSSSIDRRDAILQVIRELRANGQIPAVFVFLDSPMASRQKAEFPLCSEDVDTYGCIQAIDTVLDSKRLNQITGTAIIMAGAGKGGHGRIGFHLEKNLPRPECAIVLFGPQPEGSIGRRLAAGHKTISILGHRIRIKAKVHSLGDPAIHLDALTMAEWLGRMRPAPTRVCVVHGRPESKTEFQQTLGRRHMSGVCVPPAGDRISL